VCGRRTPPFTCCGHRWCRHRRVVSAAAAAASRRRRRGVVVAAVVVVVVAAAITTAVAVAATTVAAATDTDRKEARVVRARAHALPRMRIEREGLVSLLPPQRIRTRRFLFVVAADRGVRCRGSTVCFPSSHFLLTQLIQSIFFLCLYKHISLL